MPPQQPQAVTAEVAAAIEAGVCTFSLTGRTFAVQQWVHCFTCGLIGDKARRPQLPWLVMVSD
jgi:hypothetical protein